MIQNKKLSILVLIVGLTLVVAGCKKPPATPEVHAEPASQTDTAITPSTPPDPESSSPEPGGVGKFKDERSIPIPWAIEPRRSWSPLATLLAA